MSLKNKLSPNTGLNHLTVSLSFVLSEDDDAHDDDDGHDDHDDDDEDNHHRAWTTQRTKEYLLSKEEKVRT